MVKSALSLLVAVFAAAAASGSDWPMWRCDPARSGCSPTDLPEALHLQWQRDLPPARPAWPRESRLIFDPCYEPVAAGKLLFVGSPNDGSVTAYDTATGDLRWRTYTNGPVRFAPVVWEGKVYVASDDGRLYCLAAETGRLAWVFRVAPAERPDRFHLGNGRVISFWPVRGGPVIAGGTLYAGAGVWPVLGTFVVALDPATGRVKWRNGRLNHLANIRTDHNRIADSALCPQGYLVFAAGRLLAPNGRSMPVGLAPDTGELLYFVQGYRNGHCRVTTNGKHVFVGRNAVLDITTGREMGARWHEGHPDTPRDYSQRWDLFETPAIAYKFMRGCDAWSALGGMTSYGGLQGAFHAYDLARAAKSTYKKKKGDLMIEPAKWDAPLLWKLATAEPGTTPSSRAVIKAGQRIYGHADKKLVAVTVPAPGGEPTIAWQKELPGTPGSLAAADGKLFVSTLEGRLLCFGAEQGQAVSHPRVSAPLPDRDDEWRRRAETILESSAQREGYCVVLGIDRGRLVEGLLRQSKLKVVAVGADRAGVDSLRDRLKAAGLYGNRAEVLVGDPATFELPPYLASLLVSEIFTDAAAWARMAPARLVSVLRPYGGVACIRGADAAPAVLKTWLSPVLSQHVRFSQSGGLGLLRRVGAPPESADWTHESASAARTYFSRDKLVKPPLGVLWYGDSAEIGFKKRKDYHSGVKPQVTGGRLFAFEEREKYLQAYDVYTGRILWRRDVVAFTRFASMPDGIYVGQDNACVVLDPATGRELKRFPYRVGDGEPRPLFVADLKVGDDAIVVAAAFEKVRSIPQGLYDADVLIGLDRSSGSQLWTLKAADRFNHHGLALGRGLVFCADSPSAKTVGDMKRRGGEPESLESLIRALDARTGAVRWEKRFANAFLSYEHSSYPQGSIQSLDDSLFYSTEHDVLIVYKDRRYRAVKGETGELLWEQARGSAQPIMVGGAVFYNGGGGAYDIRTGGHVPGKSRIIGGNGCNHAVACEHLFFRRRFTAAYFDVTTGKATYMLSARSGCTNSLIPACGVLSAPCFSVGCVCNHPLETSFCLIHMPVAAGWLGSDAVREPMPLGERDPVKYQALIKKGE